MTGKSGNAKIWWRKSGHAKNLSHDLGTSSWYFRNEDRCQAKTYRIWFLDVTFDWFVKNDIFKIVLLARNKTDFTFFNFARSNSCLWKLDLQWNLTLRIPKSFVSFCRDETWKILLWKYEMNIKTFLFRRKAVLFFCHAAQWFNIIVKSHFVKFVVQKIFANCLQNSCRPFSVN